VPKNSVNACREQHGQTHSSNRRVDHVCI
jgi:hypothetical protein